MRNYILLTGATGLLGQYLVRDMQLDGHRLAVLVRGTKSRSPRDRIEQTQQMWERQLGQPLQRPVVLTGDITQPNLGLSNEDVEWVRKHCTTMLHCAASLTFHEHNGEPWRTNIEGTKHVLQLCVDLDIREMHYISTAYVCGHRHDLVMESDLDVGQEFRNDYEKSKFTAETLVRECPVFDSLTVYRPVVITGDSQSGYTSTYHGTYLYMKLASVLKSNTEPNEKGEYHVPVRWGLTGEELRNITCVDWNSKVICEIFNNRKAHGKTFHMAPSDPITMRDAISYASDFYGLTGIEFRGFGRKPDQPLNEMERWLWSNISIYGSYDFMDPRFDTTNLNKFAPIPCPKLDRDLAMKLMEYAEEDRWGKRKPPALAAVPICITSLLESQCASDDSESASVELGLDVLGPGGGAWTIRIADQTVVGYEAGLPSTPDVPVVRIDTKALAELQGRGHAAADQLASCFVDDKGASSAESLAAAILQQPVSS